MNPRLRRGEWDSNPRVLANMGLAIPRPTRLGDPRFTIIFWHGYINYLQSKFFFRRNVGRGMFHKYLLGSIRFANKDLILYTPFDKYANCLCIVKL